MTRVPPEDERRQRPVVLVGNGPSALDRKLGPLIDSHGMVVRFNWYVTAGFEDWVGQRTDIWFTTVPCPVRMRRSYQRVYEHSWEWDPSRDTTYQRLRRGYRGEVRKVGPEVIEEMVRFVRDRRRSRPAGLPYRHFSTGAIAAHILLREHCRVNIVGFDWWQDRGRHHYADEQERGSIHDPSQEWAFFAPLIADGKVRFLR